MMREALLQEQLAVPHALREGVLVLLDLLAHLRPDVLAVLRLLDEVPHVLVRRALGLEFLADLADLEKHGKARRA